MSAKGSKKKKKQEDSPKIKKRKALFVWIPVLATVGMLAGSMIMQKTLAPVSIPLGIAFGCTLLLFFPIRKIYRALYNVSGYKAELGAFLWALFAGGGMGFCAVVGINRMGGNDMPSELTYPIEDEMMEEEITRTGRKVRRKRRRMRIEITIDGFTGSTKWSESYLDKTNRYDAIKLSMHTGLFGWRYYTNKALVEKMD